MGIFRRRGPPAGTPYQQQPTNQQYQIAGPQPGIGLLPSRGSQRARNGVAAPFGANDPINGPGRDSELIRQAQSGTPMNAFLAQMVPDSVVVHYKHAHRIRTGIAPYYPPRVHWPDKYAEFQSPGAYTSIRPVYKTFAPIALQRTAGGLVLASGNLPLMNINTQLATMYLGAKAPTSFNQSGSCK